MQVQNVNSAIMLPALESPRCHLLACDTGKVTRLVYKMENDDDGDTNENDGDDDGGNHLMKWLQALKEFANIKVVKTMPYPY